MDGDCQSHFQQEAGPLTSGEISFGNNLKLFRQSKGNSPLLHHWCALPPPHPSDCWLRCLHVQDEELCKESHQEGREPALWG